MRECSCGGFTAVYSTRRRDDGTLVRYLRCSQCGETAKQLVPDEFSRRNRVASSSNNCGLIMPTTR